MRIVLDARHIRDFGYGTYIRNLVRALAAIDRENAYSLVCMADQQGQFSALPPNFSTALYWHHDKEHIDHFAFPAFVRRLSPDLIHIPLNRVPWFLPQPYVVTVHDMSRQLLSGAGWRNQLSLYRARRGLMRAAKVIAVSDATQRNVESVLSVPSGRFRKIFNAIDPDFVAQTTSAEKRREILQRYQVDYPYILYAGKIQPQKNLPRLIEAFSVLRSNIGSHPQYSALRLIVIGDEISKNPAVRRAAVQSRVESSIRFLGFVPLETLRAFYESAAVFAFPSLHEGFGLPPLEAMACGTPVVTSNVSSLPEVVGDAAIQVSPDIVFDIASALERVLCDEQLRLDLIKRGYRQVSRFSWERTAREVLETYREASVRN